MIRRLFPAVLLGLIGCNAPAPPPPATEPGASRQGEEAALQPFPAPPEVEIAPPPRLSRQEAAALPTFRGHTKEIDYLAFSADYSRLVTVSNADRTVRVWDARTGREISQIAVAVPGGRGDVGSVQFSPDAQKIVTGHGWNYDPKSLPAIRIWDANTGKLVKELHAPGRFFGGSGAISPDGKYMLLAGGSPFTSDRGINGIQLLNLETEKIVWTVKSVPYERVGFIPGTPEVYNANGYELYRRDLATGKQVGERVLWGQHYGSVILSDNAKRAITTTAGRTQVWDLMTAKTVFAHLGKTNVDPQRLGIADYDFAFPDRDGISTSPVGLALSDDGTAALLSLRRYKTRQEPEPAGMPEPGRRYRPITTTEHVDEHFVIFDVENGAEVKRTPAPKEWKYAMHYFFRDKRPFALVANTEKTTLQVMSIFP